MRGEGNLVVHFLKEIPSEVFRENTGLYFTPIQNFHTPYKIPIPYFTPSSYARRKHTQSLVRKKSQETDFTPDTELSPPIHFSLIIFHPHRTF